MGEPEALEFEEGKKKEKPNQELITAGEKQQINDMVTGTVDERARDRVRSVLKPEGIKRIIRDHHEHLRSVEDALMIADRWSPRNKNKTEKKITVKDEKTGLDKEITIALPMGNIDDLRELEADAIALAALNTKVSMVWAISKAAVNRAEAHLEAVKAEAKKAISEQRRAGFLRGKLGNAELIESMSRTTHAVLNAQQDLLDVQEQAALLEGCYYSTQKMGDFLVGRAKSLQSEFHRSNRQTT